MKYQRTYWIGAAAFGGACLLAVSAPVFVAVHLSAGADQGEKSIVRVVSSQDMIGGRGIHSKEEAGSHPFLAPPSPLPSPPAVCPDFWSWTDEQQLGLVTDWQADPALPADIVSFIVHAVAVKKMWLTTRNNLANALCNQHDCAIDLTSLFQSMVLDRSESDPWREYALQHLAVSLGKNPAPNSGLAVLWGLAESGPQNLAGTALLQLNRLCESGITTLDDRYDALLIERARGGQDIAEEVQTTAISLLGERKVLAALELIRVLTRHPSASVRRTAIASMGTIGSDTDLPMLRGFIDDSDANIVAAAISAIQVLCAVEKQRSTDHSRVPSSTF